MNKFSNQSGTSRDDGGSGGGEGTIFPGPGSINQERSEEFLTADKRASWLTAISAVTGHYGNKHPDHKETGDSSWTDKIEGERNSTVEHKPDDDDHEHSAHGKEHDGKENDGEHHGEHQDPSEHHDSWVDRVDDDGHGHDSGYDGPSL